MCRSIELELKNKKNKIFKKIIHSVVADKIIDAHKDDFEASEKF